jgi:hypothetical protein
MPVSLDIKKTLEEIIQILEGYALDESRAKIRSRRVKDDLLRCAYLLKKIQESPEISEGTQ